jgi:hypothetical protein
MNLLLEVTAVVEGLTGLALLAAPSIVSSLLLGAGLEALLSVTVARVAGAALLTVAVISGLAGRRGQGAAAADVTVGILIYNVVVTSLFVRYGLGPPPHGIALWPAALAHAALALWCIGNLRAARWGGYFLSL